MIQNLRPASIGDYDTFTLIAGASKVAACDPGAYPESHDDATTYIRSSAGVGGYNQAFVVGNKPVVGILNSLTLGARVRGNFTGGTATINLYARFSSTDGAANTDTTGGSSWVTKGPSTIGRPGGGSWVKSDIDRTDLQVKINFSNSGSDTADCTSLWFKLDFYPPVGGYIAHLSSLVGAAIGLHELPNIAKEFFKRSGIKLMPDDYVAAFNELRYDPRRKLFI